MLPVILFHAGFPYASGGFVGVDIFFLISGFLITSIIVEEMKIGNFQFVKFFERRARRILPALTAMLIVSTLAAYFLMPANLLRAYLQSLVAVVTFSSNIFFFLTRGYFSTLTEEIPLLHTWSLAIEEQFYLLFPLLFVFIWPYGKRVVIALLTIIALASLLFAQHLAMSKQVDANYYLLFSRVWELLLGSVIALAAPKPTSVSNSMREILSIVGLSLIVTSIVLFDKNTPIPGVYALAPVGGAAVLIIFTDSSTVIGRFLSHKLLVGIGLISYSLYLWHQPVLAFMRLRSIGEPGLLIVTLAVLFVFALATTSYRWVEVPFRRRSNFTSLQILKYSLVAMFSMGSIGIAGHLNRGFESSFVKSEYSNSIMLSPQRAACHTQDLSYLRPDSACKYYGSNITWAVLGDSHVVEPAFALANRLKITDEGVLHLSFSSCAPAVGFVASKPGCTEWVSEALRYLEGNTNITSVMVGFRYTSFLFGDQLKTYPKIPNTNTLANFVFQPESQTQDAARELYWAGLREIVFRLIKSGKKVYLMYPIPELPADISKVLAPFSIYSTISGNKLTQTSPISYYLQRNEFILRKLDSLKNEPGIYFIKPMESFCDAGYCKAVQDNKALYVDDHHVSVYGAELIVKNVILRE